MATCVRDIEKATSRGAAPAVEEVHRVGMNTYQYFAGVCRVFLQLHLCVPSRPDALVPSSLCGKRQLAALVQQHVGPDAAAAVEVATTRLTGFDKSSINLTASQAQERQHRLDANCREPLFHQTAADGTRGIIQDAQMNPGKTGIAGGGIYFAVCANDTMHKAHWHGWLLTVQVRLGTVETWPSKKVDTTVTFAKLQAR